VTWKSRVYRKRERNEGLKHWGSIVAKFCKVFKYQCQACRKRCTKDRLTVHHIIPREFGGDEDDGNLILLCRTCHDEIESDWKKYNTYRKIAYAFAKNGVPVVTTGIPVGKDWRQWVYGGARNPQSE